MFQTEDSEDVAEKELLRLQRQHLRLNNPAIGKLGSIRADVLRQKKMIGAYEKEKQELLADLQVAMSDQKQKRSQKLMDVIKTRLNKSDKLDEEVKKEKDHLMELEGCIRTAEKELLNLKRKDLTDSTQQARVAACEKKLHVLENRLHVENVKFNEILCSNAKYKEKIEHHAKERFIFSQQYDELMKSLNKGARIMVELIDQATETYDLRDEQKRRLQFLKEKARQSYNIQNSEMENFQRIAEKKLSLQTFLAVKGQKRVMQDLIERELKKKAEKRLEVEQKALDFKGIVDKIKEFSKEEEFLKIATHFTQQEEDNFGLFCYLKNVKDEVHTLRYDVSKLRLRINEDRIVSERALTTQKDNLQQLKEECDKQKEKCSKLEEKIKHTNEVLFKCFNGIKEIFDLVRGDNTSLLKLLGNHKKVTDFNAMLYVALIERRTNALLNMVYYKEKVKEKVDVPSVIEETRAKPAVPPLSKIVPNNPCSFCAENEDVTEIHEEYDAPMESDEILYSITQRIETGELESRLHSLSDCKIYETRLIQQRRYQ